MSIKNTKKSYGSVTKSLHWLIALGIILMLCAGFSFDFLANGPFKFQLMQLHKATGLTLLVLVWLRILWWLINTVPVLPTTTPTWQRISAHGMHFLLYMLTLIMPLSGWIMSTASGHATNMFGLLTITTPGITQGSPLGQTMHQWHHWGGWVLLVLVILHIIAAIKHHCIDHNDILQRMLPTWITRDLSQKNDTNHDEP